MTEIVQKVTHTWHPKTVDLARHRAARRLLTVTQAPVPGPAKIASTATEPRPATMLLPEARDRIAPLPKSHLRPLASAGPRRRLARMAHVPLRTRHILYRSDSPLATHSSRARAESFHITQHRHQFEAIPRAAPDRTLRPPQPRAMALPREPRPVARSPAEPYGPRLEPQRALPQRQFRAGRPFELSREAHSERRRMRAFDRRPGRGRPHPHRGRFNF